MIIQELVAKLGINIDRNKWNEAQNKLDGLKKSFFSLKIGLVATGAAFTYFESKLGKMFTGLSNQSMLLQIPVKQLQAIELAANKTAIPLSTVMGALNNFQTGFTNLKAGFGLPSGWAQAFTKLGQLSGQQINPFGAKNGYQLFSQVASAINSIHGVQNQEMVSNQFGITQLLPLIRGGQINKAYGQLSKSGLFYSNEMVQQGREFNAQLQTTITSFKYISAEIGLALLPPLKELNNSLIKLSQNKNFVSDLKIGIQILGEYASMVAKVIEETVKFLSLAAKGVNKVTNEVEGGYKKYVEDPYHHIKNIPGAIESGLEKIAGKLGISKHHVTNNYINRYGSSIGTIHQTGNIR